MAWCPNCKNEYVPGIKICADCGAELVEKLPEEYDDEFEEMEYKDYAETEGESFDGFCEEEGLNNKEASEQIIVEMDVSDKDSLRVAMPTTQQPKMVSAYHNSKDQAEENRSSAWVLMIVGILGLLAVILAVVGIIPFHAGNPYMFYGVMSAVFILFIVMGIVSMRNAKIFEGKAKSEHNLEKILLNYVEENMTKEQINAVLIHTESVSDEELFLIRCEYIRRCLNHTYMNLDQGFLEHLIEDKIYDMIFADSESNEKE